MPDPIDPIGLSEVLPGEGTAKLKGATGNVLSGEDPFSVVLDRAVAALEDVSSIEEKANQLIKNYAVGEASLSEVMVATAKMSIAVSLAVTTITTAVNTFKEITQMQV